MKKKKLSLQSLQFRKADPTNFFFINKNFLLFYKFKHHFYTDTFIRFKFNIPKFVLNLI